MCDYSLMHVKSRAAAVDDRLVTTKFPDASTRGFAAVDDPTTAVCVLPGTELAFDSNIETYAPYTPGAFYGDRRIEYQHKVARFRQVDKEIAHRHHDALELPDGTIVKLYMVVSGQPATVLQLPAQPKNAAEEAEQKRVEVVG